MLIVDSQCPICGFPTVEVVAMKNPDGTYPCYCASTQTFFDMEIPECLFENCDDE